MYYNLWHYGSLFIGIVISVIIILLIRKKLMGKNKKLKILVYAIIIIFCILVFKKLEDSAWTYLSTIPDEVYTEMKEICYSKRLIGLSKEEVIALLGKPPTLDIDSKRFIYYAGKTTNYLDSGKETYYRLWVKFDENDRVEGAYIWCPPKMVAD